MYLVNNVQYDSVSGVLGWQARYRWIVRPGNDVFIVYTHNWVEDPFGPSERFLTLDRRARRRWSTRNDSDGARPGLGRRLQ